MDVIKTLKPGQNGTQRLIERYGADLPYRDNPALGMRYTTVELIVPRKPLLKPSSPRAAAPAHPLQGKGTATADQTNWRALPAQVQDLAAG